MEGEYDFSTFNAVSFFMLLCIHMLLGSGSLDFGPEKKSNNLNMKLKQGNLRRVFLERKGNYGTMFSFK